MSAIGYYKVFTTEAPLSALDFDAWPGPADRSVQWIFPFAYEGKDAALLRALEKAGEVSARLGGAVVSDVRKVRRLDHVYAIRVGKERPEA